MTEGTETEKKYGHLNSGGLNRRDFGSALNDLRNMLSPTFLLDSAEPGKETDDMIRLHLPQFPANMEEYHDNLIESHVELKKDIWAIRKANPSLDAQITQIMDNANELREKMIANRANGIAEEDVEEMRMHMEDLTATTTMPQ